MLGFLAGQEEDLIKLAPKGSAEKLSAKIALIRAEAARERGIAIRSITGDGNQLAKTLADIDTRRETKISVATQANAREGVSAGQKTASMLDTLKAKFAEMSDGVNDGAGEWAKYWSKLGNDGARGSKIGQDILAQAKAVDELTIKLEKANTAWSTLKSLQRQSDEGRNELGASLDVLASGRDVTGLDAAYNLAAAKAKRAVDDLNSLRGVGLSTASALKAAQDAADALPGIAQGQIATQLVAWRQAQRQIVESLAETSAEKRKVAYDTIADEEKANRALIANAELKGEALKKIEDDLAAYLSAKRAQVDRETEGAIAKQMRDWGKFSENIESSFAKMFDGLTDGLTEFVMTGKFSMTDLANSFIRDITRMALKALASGLFGDNGKGGVDFVGFAKSLAKGIAGYFSGGGVSNSLPVGVQPTSGLYHSGGIIGRPAPTMQVNPAWFENAPRFHNGTYLKSNEVPAVLERGEAVFTADQLGVLGRMNRSYAFVEQALGTMMSALSAVPLSAQPSMPASGTGNSAATPGPVTINLINKSDQQMEATAGAPRMDIEGMIIDVVISNMQRPGRMRDAVRGAG